MADYPILINPAEALKRCASCRHMGRGKYAGLCKFQRDVNRAYRPITAFKDCERGCK